MWLDRGVYEDLVVREARSRAAATALERQMGAIITMNDWLRIRTEQLERERAQLLLLYTGVKVDIPQVRHDSSIEDVAAGIPNFEGLNDDEAGKLGIAWNPDGTVAYKR